MSYVPVFETPPRLLTRIAEIEVLRTQIITKTDGASWIVLLQDEARIRNAHASTAIEGNPLTLKQVREVAEGSEVPTVSERHVQEVRNSLAGFGFIERFAKLERISHEHVFELHKIIAQGVMHQGEAGRYRTIQVRVGPYFPPPPYEISGLMFELLEWWNAASGDLSPVLSSAIVHYRFEAIHPFADGNGRTGRVLGLWDLYRRRFDSNRIFPVDEYFWEDPPRYYAALQTVRKQGEDLTSWLEYCAEGLLQTLQRVGRSVCQAG